MISGLIDGQPACKPSPRGSSMKPKRILIVDPDSNHCDKLEESLSTDRYLVYTASNRFEAEKLEIGRAHV
jgi:PleD family two-component response regulator